MSDLFGPMELGDFGAFPVGQRVEVVAECQDMHFFHVGEPGVVIRNSGHYLGVIVAFDRPWKCDHQSYIHDMADFNFNPVDLRPVNP